MDAEKNYKFGFARYVKNQDAFTEAELAEIWKKSVCVIGCGGLGGYVIQTLARFGIGKMTIVDGDIFTVANLNRQVFSNEQTIGESKALTAQKALEQINSDIEVTAVNEMLNEKNAMKVISDHDIVMDCLDNAPARILIEKTCTQLKIPFIHGAISGFCGQVSAVFPGDGTLNTIYAAQRDASEDASYGAPAFTPQLVAAMQCSEALKVLSNKGETLRNRILTIDLLNNVFEIFDTAGI